MKKDRKWWDNEARLKALGKGHNSRDYGYYNEYNLFSPANRRVCHLCRCAIFFLKAF